MPARGRSDEAVEGLLLGVATAGFQVEGGFNGPGEPANNWLWWERSGRSEPSGIACDFWREPSVALDRAASLGCDAFRLSIEWPRIEPQDGEIDDGAIGHYSSILAGCNERGMAPVVTLHHFTHPWYLGEEFWLTPGSPDRFARYVERVLPALVPHCNRWITVNEPNIVALMGWVAGASPPGRRMAVADAVAVLDNLLTAHVLAYEAVKRFQPEGVVTVNTSSSSLYEHDRLLTDLLFSRAAGVRRDDIDEWLDERRAVHDATFPPHGPGELALRRLFAAASPYGRADAATGSRFGRSLRARMRRPSPRRVVDAVYKSPFDCTLDSVGFDWYDPVASRAMCWPGHRNAVGRQWGPSREIWDVPPHPGELTTWCRDQHVLLPNLPLWVVENGLATLVRHGRSYPRADGWDRPRYLQEHVGAVVDAVDAGTPVEAYLHWSLVDNYEWGTYEPRFGIFGVDRSRGDKGVRWLDTDAEGRDAPGTYRRIIAGLRDGDRSVLGVR